MVNHFSVSERISLYLIKPAQIDAQNTWTNGINKP